MFLHISVISTLKNIPITYRDIFCKSQKNPFSLISFDDIAHFQCINLPIALQHKVISKKNYYQGPISTASYSTLTRGLFGAPNASLSSISTATKSFTKPLTTSSVSPLAKALRHRPRRRRHWQLKKTFLCRAQCRCRRWKISRERRTAFCRALEALITSATLAFLILWCKAYRPPTLSSSFWTRIVRMALRSICRLLPLWSRFRGTTVASDAAGEPFFCWLD